MDNNQIFENLKLNDMITINARVNTVNSMDRDMCNCIYPDTIEIKLRYKGKTINCKVLNINK